MQLGDIFDYRAKQAKNLNAHCIGNAHSWHCLYTGKFTTYRLYTPMGGKTTEGYRYNDHTCIVTSEWDVQLEIPCKGKMLEI